MMPFASLADVEALDRADPIASFRDRFALPAGVIYLDGNSLGPLPLATLAAQADAVANQWGSGLIRSWNDAGWIDAPLRIGAKLAPLIGAGADEVVVTDSTSVNLFKAVVAAAGLDPRPGALLTEAGNFPTDLYIARGAVAALPHMRLDIAAPGEILSAIGADTRVVLLTHVHYKTGHRHDMAAITRAAHAVGAVIIWDISHSAGAVAIDLNGCDVDLAVGCGYKYLNGGPGAPSFLFAARRLQPRLRSPLAGWFGHVDPFAFTDDFVAAPGIARFQCGTPPMLSLLALETGIDVFVQADTAALFAKSAALFDVFADLVAARCPALELVTACDPAARGSHISFAHPSGYAIVQALIARGVIGDFRAPDVLRFGLTPLYLGFADVWRAVDQLADVLDHEHWRDPRFSLRSRVT